MPKLEVNVLDEKALWLLKKHKIYSVNDFLLADFEKKVVASNLNEVETFELIQKLINSFSAQPTNGLKFYQYLLKKTNVIETYIRGLDELLNGGLLTGSIIEVCGLSGSGKTQICLTITINIAARSKSNVTYIDMKNDFSSSRLLQILRTINSSEDVDDILDRINIITVTNLYELITTLNCIKNGDLLSGKLGQLLILDSLPTLFFQFIGLDNNEGISLLNHIASLLKFLATERHTAVIITNLASIYEENLFNPLTNNKLDEENDNDTIEIDLRPSLGKYWLHVPNTRLNIIKINSVNTERLLIVKKSDYIKLDNRCIVVIDDGGVR